MVGHHLDRRRPAAVHRRAGEFGSLPEPLKGLGTHGIYITPKNKIFDLGGPRRGRQGVRFYQQLTGDQQWPFTQVLTNSPYIMGADINRTNIPERLYQAGIVIGSHNPPMSEYQYRMAEDNWWEGQDENNDGWLGMYTRFTGWRFEPVRPHETVKTPQPMDVTAFGNNVSTWDITWIASRPYFTKPAVYDTFLASKAGTPKPPPSGPLIGLVDELIGDDYYWGTLVLANKGTLPSYATFLVSSPRAGHRAGQRLESAGSAAGNDDLARHLHVRHRTRASDVDRGGRPGGQPGLRPDPPVEGAGLLPQQHRQPGCAAAVDVE